MNWKRCWRIFSNLKKLCMTRKGTRYGGLLLFLARSHFLLLHSISMWLNFLQCSWMSALPVKFGHHFSEYLASHTVWIRTSSITTNVTWTIPFRRGENTTYLKWTPHRSIEELIYSSKSGTLFNTLSLFHLSPWCDSCTLQTSSMYLWYSLAKNTFFSAPYALLRLEWISWTRSFVPIYLLKKLWAILTFSMHVSFVGFQFFFTFEAKIARWTVK